MNDLAKNKIIAAQVPCKGQAPAPHLNAPQKARVAHRGPLHAVQATPAALLVPSKAPEAPDVSVLNAAFFLI